MVYDLRKIFKTSNMPVEVANNYQYDLGSLCEEIYIEHASTGLSKEKRSYKKWLIDNGAEPGETVFVVDDR